ncbi:hypothetical protein EDI_158730 [Entamoeba dispar SAW760]|uniref:Uncharacterized protein n=1 Tax=Entamoeba dispar (strain ATCC PRA-260 / SAW760) TaxID=370354 RepID=B0E9T8_ENTDS|nr:uncharacterized protein EDI_158730 [Entamoeba dispar SAW760]EDR28735.1 hypothetical protein EDI_158730 [Entamoeba dispar SAW760]|eukprot:EDR28735.1 hypothetical protein EDI_158730 [Entamoeba dispar SAW760]
MIVIFISIFISICSAQYLRHCMYFDEECKRISSCEFIELNACLSIPDPKNTIEYFYSKTVQIENEVVSYHFSSNELCLNKSSIPNQVITIKQLGVCISDESIYIIDTIVDQLDGIEQGAVGYLSNATFVFSNDNETKPCSMLSTIQVIYNSCVEVMEGTYSKAIIINNTLTLQTFRDKECTNLAMTNIESPCGSCIKEYFGNELIRYVNVHCYKKEEKNETLPKQQKEL